LADVFENFRTLANNEDGLEPLNFFSIPGLSWASALKSMNHSLELIQDPNMFHYFESGIRGGMTFVNKHYTRKTATDDMLYIDVNNLYSWALSQLLPCRDFKWISDENMLNKLIMEIPQMDCKNTKVDTP